MEYSHRTGVVRRHDERSGLPDDWITTLARTASGDIYAGTFVGGLATRNNAGWFAAPELRGANVTALEKTGAAASTSPRAAASGIARKTAS